LWSTLQIQEFSVSADNRLGEVLRARSGAANSLGKRRDGYVNYKIPAFLVSTKGTLLAFCEGRHKFSDSADIEYCAALSGQRKTWTKQQIVWDDGTHTCGQSLPGSDRDTGAIWMLMCRDNDKVFATSSADDGITWSGAVEITSSPKRKDWSWYATGPAPAFSSSAEIQRTPRHPLRPRVQSTHGFARGLQRRHGTTWKMGAAIKPA